MAALPNRFRISAIQNIDNVIQAERKAALLPHPLNTRQEFLRWHRAIERFPRLQTVIAAVAWRQKFFTEIFQQRRTPAIAGFGVMNRVAQLFLRDALLAFAFFLDEASLFHDIARAEEQHAFTGQAIAPGPPRFLIITFDVLRQIVMNNKTDIRL